MAHVSALFIPTQAGHWLITATVGRGGEVISPFMDVERTLGEDTAKARLCTSVRILAGHDSIRLKLPWIVGRQRLNYVRNGFKTALKNE